MIGRVVICALFALPLLARASATDLDLSPAQLESKVRRVTLAGGLTLAELQHKTSDGVVSGAIVLPFGDLDGRPAARQTAILVSRSLSLGAGDLSNKEITDKLAALHMSVYPAGDRLELRFLGVPRGDLPAVLDLAATLLRHPAFPEREVDKVRLAWVNEMWRDRANPEKVAQAAIDGFDDLPASTRHKDRWGDAIDAISGISVEDVRAFHRDFYGAAALKVALVGDFDAPQAEARLAALFGDWKAGVPYSHSVKPFAPKPAKRTITDTPGAGSAAYRASIAFPLEDNSPDYPLLLLATRILGDLGADSRLDQSLNGAIGERRASLAIDRRDGSAALVVTVGFASQFREKVALEVPAALAALRQDGVTQYQLDEAREGLLTARNASRGSDAELAAIMANQLLAGAGFEREVRIVDAVKSATVEDVDKAIQTYFAPEHMVEVFAGNFSGSPAGSTTKFSGPLETLFSLLPLVLVCIAAGICVAAGLVYRRQRRWGNAASPAAAPGQEYQARRAQLSQTIAGLKEEAKDLERWSRAIEK